jgi:hypothetical protein
MVSTGADIDGSGFGGDASVFGGLDFRFARNWARYS